MLWSDRNSQRKNPHAAFAALAPVIAEHPDIVLYLHTKMEDEGGAIATWIERYGLSRNIRFTPGLDSFTGVPAAHLNALYNAAHIRIATSLGEGFGLHGAEVAAAGTAQVAPDNSCFREVIGPGALYVPRESWYTTPRGADLAFPSIPALSDAVRSLYIDAPLRERLGRAGHQHVAQRFSWDAAAAQMADLIQTTAAQGLRRVLVG